MRDIAGTLTRTAFSGMGRYFRPTCPLIIGRVLPGFRFRRNSPKPRSDSFGGTFYLQVRHANDHNGFTLGILG
jgi:hypothetical protein